MSPSDRPPIPPELARGYLTHDLAAISGESRAEPEDFVVEEVPLYEPSGEGTHLYLRIEKRGISTDEAIRRLAKRLGVKRRSMGYAGRKDARAVTRQTISALGCGDPDLRSLEDSQLKVLSATPHRNKLKIGHLAGNRFRLRLRGAAQGQGAARAVLERLAKRGVANYFGLQRFGRLRHTHRLGRALVEGDADAFLELLLLGARPSQGETQPEVRPGSPLAQAREAIARGDHALAQRCLPASFSSELAACRALAKGRAPDDAARAVPFKQRAFYVAAFQSQLFNAYLTRRLERVDGLEVGEVATLHRNGASFLVTDALAEAPRCAAFEISPSGPLFGKRLLRPAEGSGARADEDAILAELAPGLSAELTPSFGAKPQGLRRPLRIPLRDVEAQAEGDDLLLAFMLPRGCYATAVLEELFKRQVD